MPRMGKSCAAAPGGVCWLGMADGIGLIASLRHPLPKWGHPD
jgi:hypothetical protein